MLFRREPIQAATPCSAHRSSGSHTADRKAYKTCPQELGKKSHLVSRIMEVCFIDTYAVQAPQSHPEDHRSHGHEDTRKKGKIHDEAFSQGSHALGCSSCSP